MFGELSGKPEGYLCDELASHLGVGEAVLHAQDTGTSCA